MIIIFFIEKNFIRKRYLLHDVDSRLSSISDGFLFVDFEVFSLIRFFIKLN